MGNRSLVLVIVGYSVALGAGTVTIPLLALAAGYDAPSIGFLVAVASGAQFAGRFLVPSLLGRFTDRSLIGGSILLFTGVFALLAASTALPVFLLAQVCQGLSRAVFWTSCQAHVVHGSSRPVKALVDLTIAGTLGTLAAPVVAGWLAGTSFDLALGFSIAAGLFGTVAALAIPSHPALDRRSSVGSLALLRRDGQAAAAWGAAVSGAWWSMVGSYIPVLLIAGGLGAGAVGLAVTVSEGAGALVLGFVRSVSTERARRLVAASAVVLAGVLVAVALVPASLPLYLGLLALGGATSGSLTALAPALASAAAGPAEQGDALAISGAFRAGALLVAPATVGALLVALPLAGAMALFGGVLLVPSVVAGFGAMRPARPATIA